MELIEATDASGSSTSAAASMNLDWHYVGVRRSRFPAVRGRLRWSERDGTGVIGACCRDGVGSCYFVPVVLRREVKLFGGKKTAPQHDSPLPQHSCGRSGGHYMNRGHAFAPARRTT